MKHPITYEHVGIVLGAAIGLFVLYSAWMWWFGSTQIRSISCYNLDGTGPVDTADECGVVIKCNSLPNTNADASTVSCPFWPH